MDGLRLNEGCSLRVCIPDGYPDEIKQVAREIIDLTTIPELRNQGYAKKLLGQVCQESDVSGYSLLIQVKPFDETTEKVRLQKFYAKFGFVVFQAEPLLMCRKAKGSAH